MASHIVRSIEELEDWSHKCRAAAGVLRWLLTADERAALDARPPLAPEDTLSAPPPSPAVVSQETAPRPATERRRVPRPKREGAKAAGPQPTPKARVVDEEAEGRASRGQYDEQVVRLVSDHPGFRLSDIATRTHTSIGTMHGVLQRLVAAGRVVREGAGYHPAETAPANN